LLLSVLCSLKFWKDILPPMKKEAFQKLGYALIDWIANYRETLSERPVMSQVNPGEIKQRFAKTPPMQPESLEALIQDVERDILPGITHWNHPSFFAYFPSNTELASVLADLLTAGLGTQGMSWQTSPAATELEEVVMDWLRQMLDLPASFTGVIQDTASTATLAALLCARERSSNFSQNARGLHGVDASLIVYASDQAHSSIEKAALLAGFGKENLRYIKTNDEHALDIQALREAIERDKKEGKKPCAIIATTGTTGTTALDPIEGIAQIAQVEDIWLHVDAALAGTAMILPECRWMWRGIEQADSLVLNPHKWMGVGFDFSVYYTRDPQHLIRVMSTNPSYLRTAQDGQVNNYRDWGIPLGRRFRALKLWLVLRAEGVTGIQARLRRDLENAQWLKAQIDADASWERLAPAPLQTLCVRHIGAGLTEAEMTQHNLTIADTVNQGGKAYLTPSMLKGKQTIRISIGALGTERAHVAALWELLKAAAK
jgi:aromatic-L-amino-acid/L-tryptophan decarboxylase